MERSFTQYDDVSGLLLAWNEGDHDAFNRMFPLVYDELKRRAHTYLRHEREQHTLQTTALVHEAYLRLNDQRYKSWQNRSQFFCLASITMRRILVDYAKSRNRTKRGGDAVTISLDEFFEVAGGETVLQLLDLNEALTVMATFDPQQAMIVQLRYFGGCSIEEAAEALSISKTTVKRDWRVAKAWLRQRLAEPS